MAVQQRQLPQDLIDAVESGDATQEQLRQLIEIEAGWLGLTFDDAVERARQNALPKGYLGSNVQFLIMAMDHETNQTEETESQANPVEQASMHGERSNDEGAARYHYPEEIIAAFEQGDDVIEVTREQLIQMIECEAERLGLSFDEAVERARNDTLPKNYLGSGIQFYVMMLDYKP